MCKHRDDFSKAPVLGCKCSPIEEQSFRLWLNQQFLLGSPITPVSGEERPLAQSTKWKRTLGTSPCKLHHDISALVKALRSQQQE